MNVRTVVVSLLALGLALSLRAADEPDGTTTSQATRDAIRERMREDARQRAARPKPAPAATATTPSPSAPTPPPAPASPAPVPAAVPTPAEVPAPLKVTPTTTATADSAATPGASASDKDKAAAAAKAVPDPATVLPKVEVNRTKPSELGRQLYQQEKEIAREKQLTKSSELDKALNDPKVTLPIFGGQSTASRSSVASERVSLMEAEKDLIEEIAHAKTKEEKTALQKELAELKKMRRELEQNLR